MNRGQFQKGSRSHWKSRPHWSSDWLKFAYLIRGMSAQEIANECGVTENAIFTALHKFGIPTRTIQEARELKRWGLIGKDNPMYGKTGDQNPNWRGGVTSERQAFYSSRKWKRACSLVWKRDSATCQKCGIHKDNSTVAFHIHHVVSFAVELLRAKPSNLVLLCKDCHGWVHSNENKDGEFIQQI